MIKVCKKCGEEFKTYPSLNVKCCSKKCSLELIRELNYEKYKCECKACGVEFLPSRPKDGGMFCSYRCSGIGARSERVDRNGYWYVYMPEHINSSKQGYIPEHHLIVELDLGHTIADGMVVHHIDENKKNNCIHNLEYMSDSDHKSHHAKKRRGANGKFKQEHV